VIGGTLKERGVPVEVARLEDVVTVYPYTALVLGSAVYRGSWLRPALTFLDEHRAVLGTRPTWLFSSGPTGLATQVAVPPFDGGDLVQLVAAREHRLFGGRLLAPANLGPVERVLVGALRVPSGDFREWDDVTDWATAIARALAPG
jgi:menaquinone-dependent protoporphyrinogen oxidase